MEKYYWFKKNKKAVILNNMDNELRLLNFIKQSIKNMLENKVGNIDIVNIF